MNELQFVNETNADPFWEGNNVRTLSLSAIKYNQSSPSQVRQGGIDNGHVQAVADSIARNGQKVPITVENAGKDGKGVTIWRVIDGGHRVMAIQRLRKIQPNNSAWTVIRARVVTVSSEYDRQKLQLEANEHGHVAKSTSKEDASYWLGTLIENGIPGSPPKLSKLQGSAKRNRIDPDQYLKDLKEALEIQFPSFGGRTTSAIAKGYLKGLPGKFRTWVSDTASDEFYEYLDQSDIDIDDRHVLVMNRETNHVVQTSVGNALRATMQKEDEDVETILIAWSNKTNARSNKAVDDERLATIKQVNAVNKHSKLAKGKRFIDRVFICPQKQDGVKESGFYEVQKTRNNRFKLFFPKTGWEV